MVGAHILGSEGVSLEDGQPHAITADTAVTTCKPGPQGRARQARTSYAGKMAYMPPMNDTATTVVPMKPYLHTHTHNA